MVNRYYIVCILCLVAMMALGVSAGLAQDDTATCAALETNAFTQTGTLCATTAHGSMCYGHPNITTTFDAPTTADFFSRPGDQAELAIVEQFTTSPADIAVTPNTLGTALLNVQANLPTEIIGSVLDGKGAIYLVSGGIELSDATPPEELVEPLPQGIAVSTIAEADLRVAPIALDTPTYTNVVGRVPAESQVSADAVTPDGEWVRLVYNDMPGWVSRAVIDASANLSELVVVGPDSFTPMQSVTIAPVEADSACDLIAGLLVQGPDPVPVDVRVNGVDVRITSSAVFIPRTDGTLEIWVISGVVTIFPNDANRRVPMPPGFRAVIRISDLSFVGGENGVPYFMMTDLEMERVNIFTTDVQPIFMHYWPPLLRRIRPSGIGQALIVIEVLDRSGNVGIRRAREHCADGDIPSVICAFLAL